MTLGAVFVAEVAVLAVWGYLTPGVVIPNEQAMLVLGGTALLVALGSVAAYKLVFGGLGLAARTGKGESGVVQAAPNPPPKSLSSRSAAMWTAGTFISLVAAGAFFIGDSIGNTVALALEGVSTAGLQRDNEKVPAPKKREPGPIVSDHTPEEYMAAVQTVREGMRRGDYYEVVLRQTFSAPYSGRRYFILPTLVSTSRSRGNTGS